MNKKRRDNDQDNTNLESKKLGLKKEEHERKIQERLALIDQITDKYPDLKEMKEINNKFHESYNKRVDFGQAMIRARENCGE
jgi:cobyrinic acid a,c-diamide synthase